MPLRVRSNAGLGVLLARNCYMLDAEKRLHCKTKPHILTTWAVHVARPKQGNTS